MPHGASCPLDPFLFSSVHFVFSSPNRLFFCTISAHSSGFTWVFPPLGSAPDPPGTLGEVCLWLCLQPQDAPNTQYVERSQGKLANMSISREQRPLCPWWVRWAEPVSKTAVDSSRALGMWNKKKPSCGTSPPCLSYPLQGIIPQMPRSVLILCCCIKIFSLSTLNNTLLFILILICPVKVLRGKYEKN